jgi:DNA-binding IscR family transcriptional regulator
MKKAGIIRVTAGSGGAALVLPPEEITLYRVYMAVEGDGLRDLIGIHSMPSALCPIGRNIRAVLQKPYETVREDMRKSLQSVTLADFIAEYRKTGSGAV